MSKEGNLEKQLAASSYWLGLVSTVLAFITRTLAVFNIFPFHTGTIPLNYWSFFHGAILMFMITVASSVIAWARAQRT